MFSALANLCQVDLKLITQKTRGMLNQTGKKLRDEGITPADLERFEQWWYARDWRGTQGQPPTPPQVREKWGAYTASTAPPAPRKRTRRVVVIDPDGSKRETEMIV